MTGGQVIEVANYDRWPGYRGGQLYSFTVVKTVHTSSVRCSSAKTERNFDLVNFSVEYVVLTDSYLL
jgi:hypothetical protein